MMSEKLPETADATAMDEAYADLINAQTHRSRSYIFEQANPHRENGVGGGV
jgi:hypothetical protein